VSDYFKVKYKNNVELEEFLQECNTVLMSDERKKIVAYPNDSLDFWDSEKMKKANENLLSEISNTANVYAIFVSTDENNYALKYIGQTNSKGARSRLTNHLFKKHEKTGAKLGKVMAEVNSGHSIKISWISISPESLRHYVEEELIKIYRDKLEWNKRGKQG